MLRVSCLPLVFLLFSRAFSLGPKHALELELELAVAAAAAAVSLPPDGPALAVGGDDAAPIAPALPLGGGPSGDPSGGPNPHNLTGTWPPPGEKTPPPLLTGSGLVGLVVALAAASAFCLATIACAS